MTPDLLSALRETPGCGAMERGTDTGDVQHFFAYTGIGYGCDPCLTRLAEAVIEQVVARMPADRCWRDGSVVGFPGTGIAVPRATIHHTLLSALRSETPR